MASNTDLASLISLSETDLDIFKRVQPSLDPPYVTSPKRVWVIVLFHI